MWRLHTQITAKQLKHHMHAHAHAHAHAPQWFHIDSKAAPPQIDRFIGGGVWKPGTLKFQLAVTWRHKQIPFVWLRHEQRCPPPFLCLSFSLYFGDFFFILHLVSDWILREGQGWQVSNSVSLFIYFYHAMLLAHGMVTLFHYLNVPAVLL